MTRNPTLKRLTAGEQTALSLILAFHKEHARFPSLREQGDKAGYTHQNASQYRNGLAVKGWIVLGKDRAITSAIQPAEGYRTVQDQGDATA